MPITHAFVSAKSDGGDATLVRPSNWNADHVGVQVPALKPSTPTDDFAAASLDAAWSAHSTAGSFATTSCMTQGIDWLGSSLEMQFDSQSGTLYRTHADADLDFSAGGLETRLNTPVFMVGIVALDTSGNGIGIWYYANDGNIYFGRIASYAYAGDNSFNVSAGQMIPRVWLRVTRVSGVWHGYASVNGRAWQTGATRSDAFTVAQLHLGTFYGGPFNGRLIADYFHVAV